MQFAVWILQQLSIALGRIIVMEAFTAYLFSCLVTLATVSSGNGWSNLPRCNINSQPTTCDNTETLNELSLLQQGAQQSFESQAQLILQLSQEIINLRNGLIPIGSSPYNPASSCRRIFENDGSATTGTYWLNTGGATFEATCNFDVQLPPPNPAIGWQEIANIDLSSPSNSCPSPLRETASPPRRCERSVDEAGCESVLFPTNGVPFSKLCGRVVGYSAGTVDALASVFGVCGPSGCQTLDEPYVDGISITYLTDNSRSHIWTLVAQHPIDRSRCPCGNMSDHVSPTFVGNDYYCEVAEDNNSPLWEGQGCDATHTQDAPCCENPNLPWFCREFDQVIVTDNIEMRVCTDEDRVNEEIYFDLLRMYIQ